MSVIQKIRSRYAKLAGFIIALSLVGFILMDAASGRFGELFGHDSSVAKVNGDPIDFKEYSQKQKEYEILYSYTQNGKPLDENMRAQLEQQVLNDLINKRLTYADCEKAGVTTTPDEEKELIYGQFPDPVVQQYKWFADPNTKQFNPQYVKAFEQQAAEIDPTGKLMEEWKTIKAYVVENNRLRKYNALITKATYVPKFVVEAKAREQKDYVNIKFVKVPYVTIADKDVPVKDEDMIDYMKRHEKQYTQEQESRSIEYVSFDVMPSAEDTAKSLGTVTRLKTDLENTIDVESLVNRNSDDQYKPSFVNKRSFMSIYADSILKLPAGAVYGPYFEQGSYKISKVVEKREYPDSVICRHILVKTEERGAQVASDSAADKKLDSAMAMLHSGAEFKAVAEKYSEDEGSNKTGGEYTFTLQQKDGLVKEFGDFIFDGKAGDKKTIKVKNDAYSGYHYIEIVDQKGIQTAAKIATISKALDAGENTNSDIYAKASEFASKNGVAKLFDEAAKKQVGGKRVAENIKENDFMINGIGNSREIIRWLYEGKEGDVSAVFTVGQRYVVAKIAGIQPKGLMKIDANNRPALESIVRNEKRLKMIAEKYKSMNSVESIAQASKQPVVPVDSFNWAQVYVNHLGYVPKLIGYLFSASSKPNTVTPPFKGEDGVYFATILSKFTKPVTMDPNMVKEQQMNMTMQMRGGGQGAYMEALKKAATIKYNVKNL
ncbi:MAG: SurA N-terminal domain-containing protein [Bacteroidetes bacterium]|nr:SurA N-terminal domain-containing protein [Bacteroidota bacterium]